MLQDIFFLILSALFAFGFSILMATFVLIYKTPNIVTASVKASDILSREGYDTPPRTRRRKELAYV